MITSLHTVYINESPRILVAEVAVTETGIEIVSNVRKFSKVEDFKEFLMELQKIADSCKQL